MIVFFKIVMCLELFEENFFSVFLFMMCVNLFVCGVRMCGVVFMCMIFGCSVFVLSMSGMLVLVMRLVISVSVFVLCDKFGLISSVLV